MAEEAGTGAGQDQSKPPSVEDLRRLPRWARVAFMARCARRVQPLFVEGWPDAPTEDRENVEKAILIAERAAARAARPDSVLCNTVVAAASSPDILFHSGSNDASVAASIAASAARIAGDNHVSLGNHFDAADAAGVAAAGVAGEVVGLPSVWSDYDRLAEAAAREKWTDDTPVPPEFFGPLWPDGEPEWKLDQQQDESSESDRLVIRATIGEFAPEDEVVAELVNLYRALNELHVTRGGTGLTVDDWEIRVPAAEPAEVL